MNKRLTLLLCALVAAPLALLANGDPVMSFSAAVRSCNPVPLKVADVQIVKENLDINMGIPYTTVTVNYTLKNNAAKDLSMDYGFPVDFYGRYDQPMTWVGSDPYSESVMEVGMREKDVPYTANFRLNGKLLTCQRSSMILHDPEVYKDEEDMEWTNPSISRLWYYTHLDIPAGEEATLEVRYSVLCNWYTPLYAYGASPISRHFPHNGEFVYDFTPAQHWGNGKVDDLTVNVNVGALPAYLTESYESPTLYGDFDFNRNRSVFTAKKKNYDLAEASPLRIEFWEDYESLEGKVHPDWGNPVEDKSLPNAKFTVTAKSQEKYPAKNMIDRDPKTAWVAEGNGVDAVIDIHFDTPVPVSDIALYNGYHKTEDLWKANSRIWKMTMDVTRADGFEDETVEIDFRDGTMNNYWLRENSTGDHFGEPAMLVVTSIPRLVYGREVFVNGELRTRHVSPKDEYVSHIRLTILKTIPGTRYKDLCVSDIRIIDAF